VSPAHERAGDIGPNVACSGWAARYRSRTTLTPASKVFSSVIHLTQKRSSLDYLRRCSVDRICLGAGEEDRMNRASLKATILTLAALAFAIFAVVANATTPSIPIPSP
jgi:hypothetical protein